MQARRQATRLTESEAKIEAFTKTVPHYIRNHVDYAVTTTNTGKIKVKMELYQLKGITKVEEVEKEFWERKDGNPCSFAELIHLKIIPSLDNKNSSGFTLIACLGKDRPGLREKMQAKADAVTGEKKDEKWRAMSAEAMVLFKELKNIKK